MIIKITFNHLLSSTVLLHFTLGEIKSFAAGRFDRQTRSEAELRTLTVLDWVAASDWLIINELTLRVQLSPRTNPIVLSGEVTSLDVLIY